MSAGLPTGMEGLTYPIPFSDPENVIRIAQAAEKFGYYLVWGNDHMTTQNCRCSSSRCRRVSGSR